MNRELAVKQIRDRLRGGGQSIGTWMQIPHASIAEILGRAGYDWVAVDLEHGSIAAHQLPDLFRALELGGTLPLARLAQGQGKDCKQALDAGAGGVIVPMVESAAQLVAIRDACRWPPAGKRGVGFSRANLFGLEFEAYKSEAQAPLLVAMIEHVKAVKDVEAIGSVEGLDAILVGPYDLSASMGLTGQFDATEFVQAIETIKIATQRLGLPCGVHVVSPSVRDLQDRLAQGFRFIAYGTDALFLAQGCKR
jgi:2-dehydro-3-deoxyglucarate aldolase